MWSTWHTSSSLCAALWLQSCRPVSDGLGREVLRGKRTFCTTQLDFLDLPPTHRIIPLWDVSPDVRAGVMQCHECRYHAQVAPALEPEPVLTSLSCATVYHHRCIFHCYQNSTFTIGFKIRRQARSWECPAEVNTQHALCQPPSPSHFTFAADGSPIIEPFEDVVRKVSSVRLGCCRCPMRSCSSFCH